MKLGYVASHIFRHTFEINEAAELVRQRPDTTVYSFHRPGHGEYQVERVQEMPTGVVTWSWSGVARGLLNVLARHPVALPKSAFLLACYSFRNPIYWFKNVVVFLASLPILADIERRGINHLHASFGSSPATIAWLAKQIIGTSYSITFHSFDVYSTQPQYRDPLRVRKIRGASLVVAVHEAARQILSRLEPDGDRAKFQMIRIAVTFEPLERVDPAPEPPLLLAVGNLVEEKGFDILVQAVAILKQHDLPVRVDILGDGPEMEKLKRLVREKGLRDRIELRGFFAHGELARQLAGAAALVAPCRIASHGLRDGIPAVIVEAWRARTPLVASLVGGMGEVIVDGETGVVFPSEEPQALADAIEKVLSLQDLRARIVDAGYERANALFSAEKNVARLIELIEERTSGR